MIPNGIAEVRGMWTRLVIARATISWLRQQRKDKKLV